MRKCLGGLKEGKKRLLTGGVNTREGNIASDGVIGYERLGVNISGESIRWRKKVTIRKT